MLNVYICNWTTHKYIYVQNAFEIVVQVSLNSIQAKFELHRFNVIESQSCFQNLFYVQMICVKVLNPFILNPWSNHFYALQLRLRRIVWITCRQVLTIQMLVERNFHPIQMHWKKLLKINFYNNYSVQHSWNNQILNR